MLKFVPLLLIGLIGLFYMQSGNFTPFDPNHVSPDRPLARDPFAATLTLWAFLGLESATIPAEEVKDPSKTLPRATVLGTVATTALYVLATVSIMGVIPAATLSGRRHRSRMPHGRSSDRPCWASRPRSSSPLWR